MRNLRTACLALLGLSLIACRSDDPKMGDDDPDAPPTTMMHIQDVQNDGLVAGSPVALSGVVVTAIDVYGMKTGDIWVEEPGGGEFSGVHVFGAPTEQVAALQLGDIVDITGAVKDEFALAADTSGNTITELKPASSGSMVVTKTGTGPVPAPMVVDALAIGRMTDFMARNAEWEKWEGVLVTVTNVWALETPACILSMGNCNDPTLTKFGITGDVLIETTMADVGMVAKDDCIASATGPVDYFFDYQILPRSSADFTSGGTACPAHEVDHATCSDGIDNDGNGFGDCMDRACQVADPVCSSSVTIPMIQSGAATGAVTLTDVYVMGLSFNKKNLWVAQSLTATPNEGIYVRGTTAVLDTTVVAGAKVTVNGTVLEFNGLTTGDPGSGDITLTELSNGTVTVTAAPTTPPIPLTPASAAALDETHESVLVTLTNVKVVTKGVTPNYVGGLSQGATTFLSDDDILRLLDDAGTCYATIIGFWTYQSYDNGYGILPITTTPGGVCP